MEQGNHTELLSKGGYFASMWADQVSSTEDTASADKKSAVGYVVDEEPEVIAHETVTAEPLVDSPEGQPAEIPSNGDLDVPATVEATQPSESDGPVAFPASEPVEQESAVTEASAPVVFPSSDGPLEFPAPPAVTFPSSSEAKEEQAPVAFPSRRDSPAPAGFAFPGSETSSVNNTPSIGGTPGVTFQNIATPAREGASPDLDQDGKRRRTLSTQGIQRLARRISISGRRQGSTSSIPAAIFNSLKRDNSGLSRDSKELARDEPAKDGSVREDGSLINAAVGTPNTNDSPAGSSADLNRSKTKKDKKKESKDKKRKSTGQI